MSAWIGSGFLVLGFLAVVRCLRLVDRSRGVWAALSRSLAVVRSRELDDDAKGRAMRAESLELFRLFLVLGCGGAAGVAAPLAVLWMADRLGWISLPDVLHTAASASFLIISSVVIIAALAWSRRTKKARRNSNYSRLDRLLHRLAFATPRAQLALADLENTLFARQLKPCASDRPVFVTGLPRAGTTLFLECCARDPGFAAHCYRDMPFVLLPCLWGRFSANFRLQSPLRERAHGDGMLIDFESPEALEEVIWKAFWRQPYRPDRIQTWTPQDHPEFLEFFRDHMRKIILLRRGGRPTGVRYLSKNNLNIARTALLRRLFPDAVILVPFRRPLHQAASLHQQHHNFLARHASDAFARDYMRAIGHYDFGENLRPVDFDGWLDRRRTPEATSLAFWLEYWIAAYEHLLQAREADGLQFLGYEALCDDPESSMRAAAHAMGCTDAEGLIASAKSVHDGRPRQVDVSGIPAGIVEKAQALYAALSAVAVNRYA